MGRVRKEKIPCLLYSIYQMQDYPNEQDKEKLDVISSQTTAHSIPYESLFCYEDQDKGIPGIGTKREI